MSVSLAMPNYVIVTSMKSSTKNCHYRSAELRFRFSLSLPTNPALEHQPVRRQRPSVQSALARWTALLSGNITRDFILAASICKSLFSAFAAWMLALQQLKDRLRFQPGVRLDLPANLFPYIRETV